MTSGGVLIKVVHSVFLFLYLALLVRVFLSWVPGALDSSAGYAIYRITNPILNPLRRLIPPVGGLDITPFIAFLRLGAVQRTVPRALIALLFGTAGLRGSGHSCARAGESPAAASSATTPSPRIKSSVSCRPMASATAPTTVPLRPPLPQARPITMLAARLACWGRPSCAIVTVTGAEV